MLAAHALSFSFPGRPVLRDVSAEFPAGVITAIVGPNGAGKTTLLRILLGLLAPAQGSITLAGQPVGSIPARKRAGLLAYIPQSSQVAFPFSVGEVVALGRYRTGHGGDAHAVSQALQTVGLQDRRNDLFAQLSAGQQQRTTLARALAQLGTHSGPRYLLADEPVAAMDPFHALQTMDTLAALASTGVGVIAVLHDLSLVLRGAGRVLMLDNSGHIAAHGPTAETLTPELLGRVYGVGFRSLADPATQRPAAIIPA